MQLWLDLMMASPRVLAGPPLRLRALSIATRARIGVYDGLYVALAEREGCELVTADPRLLNTLQPTYPFIISMAAVP